MLTDEEMRYPIGKFQVPASYTAEDMRRRINNMRMLPGLVRQAVIGLSEDELDTPYRHGGWTLRQVVHHLADSHMNAMMRFKLALTEDNPTIKPYEEAYWALLPDYRLPVEPSLKLLEGVHQHLVALLESLTEKQWESTFFHPESNASYSLKRTLATYSWHGKHHLAHITETKKKFNPTP